MPARKPPGKDGLRPAKLRNHLLQLEKTPRLRIGHQQVGADGRRRRGHTRRITRRNRPNSGQPIRQTQARSHMRRQQHAERLGLGEFRRQLVRGRNQAIRRGTFDRKTLAAQRGRQRRRIELRPRRIIIASRTVAGRRSAESAYSRTIPRRSNSSRTAGVTIASRKTTTRRGESSRPRISFIVTTRAVTTKSGDEGRGERGEVGIGRG